MIERYILHRYSPANQPAILGRIPFLATGPNFFGWAIRGSLARHNEHRFVPSFRDEFQVAFGDLGSEMSRYAAAWALLQTGIVQALWVLHSEVPEEKRWEIAVEQLAKEIPSAEDLGGNVVEYLSGLSDAGHFHSYVSDDEIQLVQMPVPQET